MRIGFIVNHIKTKEGKFTTRWLGQAVVIWRDEVWTMCVGDVAYNPEDIVRARATFVPKSKHGGSDSYTADLQRKNAVKRRTMVDGAILD